MTTIYNQPYRDDYDIDITFYEQWLGLKSSLSDEIISENLISIFGSEYQANEVLEELYLKNQNGYDIDSLLEDYLKKDFYSFSQMLDTESDELDFFLDNAKKNDSFTIENIAWPFIFYVLENDKKYISTLSLNHLDVYINLIAKGIVSIAIKYHILDMNQCDKYTYYKEEASYEHFIREEVLNTEFYNRFYKSNPILLCRCFSKMYDLVLYFKEVLNHISSDFDMGSVSELSFFEGDTHAGGKTVVKFTYGFDNYYYKPKNLYVEKVFYDILDLFSIPHINYENNKYYDTYSIVKEVEYIPINSEEEARQFYFTLGQIQFILYLLGASDIHYENIVAHGKLPAIIDLETLFQINYDHLKYSSEQIKQKFKNQLELLQNIGILDIYLPGEGDGVNISALFGKAAHHVMQKEIFKNINTMDLQVEKDFVDNTNKKNIPFYADGTLIDAREYMEYFMNGFLDISKTFPKKKELLVTYIRNLSGDIIVRNVLRPTFAYADFLFYSTHPIYLTNIVRYNKLLENLFGMGFSNREIVLSEINDITHDDIPFFFSRIGHFDIYDSKGNNLGKCWEATPLEKVVERINSVDDFKINNLLINLKVCIYAEYNDINCISRDYIYRKLDIEGIFYNTLLLDANSKLTYSTLDTSIRTGILGLWFYLKSQGDDYKHYAKDIEDFLNDQYSNTKYIEEKYLLAFYLVSHRAFGSEESFEKILILVNNNSNIIGDLEWEISSYSMLDAKNDYFIKIHTLEQEILKAINSFGESRNIDDTQDVNY